MNEQIYRILNACFVKLPPAPSLTETETAQIMARFRRENSEKTETAFRRRRQIGRTVAILIAAASLTAASFTAGALSGTAPVYYDKEYAQPVEHIQTDYAVNSDGLTYGAANGDSVYIEDCPELVKALGDHGISGYIYLRDMVGEAPASPEEALAMQEAHERGELPATVIPVYLPDGKTQIDTFTKGRSSLINAEN